MSGSGGCLLGVEAEAIGWGEARAVRATTELDQPDSMIPETVPGRYVTKVMQSKIDGCAA